MIQNYLLRPGDLVIHSEREIFGYCIGVVIGIKKQCANFNKIYVLWAKTPLCTNRQITITLITSFIKLT